VSPKKGDAVAPPAVGEEWNIRFATNEAAKRWDELVAAASGNTRRAWDIMRAGPGPGPGKPTPRHHQLYGSLATGAYGGRVFPQWQIEVTGGGRIWYLLDADRHTVWITRAGVGHPKATD
jgi:hypothetical protein